MRAATIVAVLGLTLGGTAVITRVHAAPEATGSAPGVTLKSAASFTSITDPAARSAALFTEAGKVIQSPRWPAPPKTAARACPPRWRPCSTKC